MQLTLTFLTLGITILLFITNRVRADLVAIISLLTLVIFNILTPVEALAGFSNFVVIMIAGLFVVGAGLLRTCLAGMAGNLLLKWSGDNELKLFILLLIIVAVVVAFMSNTGTVALMLPIVISVALSMKISPSNDELFVQGLQEDVQRFADDYGLELGRFETDESEGLISKEIGVAEILLTSQSRLIDETVSEIGFRKKYNLKYFGNQPKGGIYFTRYGIQKTSIWGCNFSAGNLG